MTFSPNFVTSILDKVLRAALTVKSFLFVNLKASNDFKTWFLRMLEIKVIKTFDLKFLSL